MIQSLLHSIQLEQKASFTDMHFSTFVEKNVNKAIFRN
jgi:hypothetical protein